MNREEGLKKLLSAYERYYDVKTENVEEPFTATADFVSHEQQYFLIKAAKMGESLSREFVYFAEEENLTEARLRELDRIAWERGLSRVEPHSGHKNSDIMLYILADTVDEAAKKTVKGLKHYESYKHTLWGWSNYKLIVIELSSVKAFYNSQGKTLKKLINNIYK